MIEQIKNHPMELSPEGSGVLSGLLSWKAYIDRFPTVKPWALLPVRTAVGIPGRTYPIEELFLGIQQAVDEAVGEATKEPEPIEEKEAFTRWNF